MNDHLKNEIDKLGFLALLEEKVRGKEKECLIILLKDLTQDRKDEIYNLVEKTTQEMDEEKRGGYKIASGDGSAINIMEIIVNSVLSYLNEVYETEGFQEMLQKATEFLMVINNNASEEMHEKAKNYVEGEKNVH